MKTSSGLKEKKMQITVNVTREAIVRGTPREPGHCPGARAFKRLGEPMQTITLLICLVDGDLHFLLL